MGCVKVPGAMKRVSITAVWGLALYLTFFSGFALFHAYAQNELTDPHGCLIGTWVQHANADASSAPALAALVCLNEYLPSPHHTISQAPVLSHAARGPPSSASSLA